MYFTSSGERRETPISRETVEEQINALFICETFRNRKNAGEKMTDEEIATEESYERGYLNAIKDVLDLIKEIPVCDTADGKKLVKRYYPRIRVRDNATGTVRTIGGNYHDHLSVMHGDNSSRIAYINLQCLCGTDYEDEGFTFVGEHHPPEWEDNDEYVPFDEVWVEADAEEE